MDSLLPHEELETLEQMPLEERAAALEGVEQRLRVFMDQGVMDQGSSDDASLVIDQKPKE